LAAAAGKSQLIVALGCKAAAAWIPIPK